MNQVFDNVGNNSQVNTAFTTKLGSSQTTVTILVKMETYQNAWQYIDLSFDLNALKTNWTEGNILYFYMNTW